MDKLVFYKDWYDIVGTIDDVNLKVQLYDVVMTYAFTGQVIEHDQMLDLVFRLIKTTIDRDQGEYNRQCERNRINGMKGGRPSKQETEKTNNNPENPLGLEKPTETHKSQYNNINNSNSNNKDNISKDNINIIVSGKNPKNVAAKAATNEQKIELRKKEFEKSLIQYMVGHGGEYSGEMLRAFADYWTEPNLTNKKMRFEMEKTWELKRRLTTWAMRERMHTRQSPEQQRITPVDALKDLAEKLSTENTIEVKAIENE